MNRADQIIHIVKDATLERLLAEVTKEPLDHVQPRSTGRRKMKMKTRIPFRPRRRLGMLVRDVVVANQMHLFVVGNLRLDSLQKLEPFLPPELPVTRITYADNRSIEYVQRREQRRRAVAFVVVRHRAAASTFERQTRLRAI